MRVLLLSCLLLWAPSAAAFSALAHQAVVDSCWARSLVPVLERHYVGATPAQLREARSYAYGGALLQDLGYYPGNAALFTDLTHYVRTGDFVRALLDEARDRNELAFALGALAHYAADGVGHPAGANAVGRFGLPGAVPPVGHADYLCPGPAPARAGRVCLRSTWPRCRPAATGRRTFTKPLGCG